LSTDASTPLDSIDYWVDFDKDGTFAGIPEELDPPERDVRGENESARTTQ
jgi:hypothetical protein